MDHSNVLVHLNSSSLQLDEYGGGGAGCGTEILITVSDDFQFIHDRLRLNLQVGGE